MNEEATTEPRADERYLRCRRLQFREGRLGEDEADMVCADFCRTPTGLVALLDCPVWIGRDCRFFEERQGEPEALTEADLEELRDKLRVDYMRWRYWRRVRELRMPGEEEDLEETVPQTIHEIPARPEAVTERGRRKPRFPGDAPSGPPPKPVEEVDLENLPEIRPEDAPGDAPATPDAAPEAVPPEAVAEAPEVPDTPEKEPET
jgi:hypothetical protein